jgi:hypothetical protein
MTEICPFFATGSDESRAVELLKEVYCRGHQHQCARYRVLKAVGRENVPLTLYPNQTHLVEGIIRKVRAPQPHRKKQHAVSGD